MLVLGFFSSLTICDIAGMTIDFHTKPPHDNLGLILEAYRHQPVPKASAPPWKSVVHSGGTVERHQTHICSFGVTNSHNHSAFKPHPLRFVDYVACFPPLCKALLILSWCNSTNQAGANRLCHNCLANTQVDRICWAVSSSWSRNTRWSGCGRPLLAKICHPTLVSNS